LKGGAGTVGLVELQKAAGNLENTLENLLQNPDEVSCHDEFAIFQKSWARAQLALASLLDTASAT
jgi:HPt (histidine-containing phosphotransfer) domain-containing protein